MKLKNILFLLIATLLLVSCNGKKKKKTDDNNTKTEVIKNNNSGKANDVLLKKVSKIYNEQDTFSTVEIKFNLDFESPERSVSGSGTMRIANDSIIWLYVQAFGFEVARATFTKDTVTSVVKMKKQYIKKDYSVLKNFFPAEFDLSILQAIFLNQFFLFPDNNINSLGNYSVEENDDNFVIASGLEDIAKYHLDNQLTISKLTNKVSQYIFVEKRNNLGLKISYNDLTDFGLHSLPKQVVFEGIGKDMKLTFTYNKVVFGKKLSFPISIPDSYTEIKF
ncbi:MAG: DUF4292 domain-containing protein [Bacteroidales bacterium]|nr:DUF4292 domain-containing protein [Bacteroidales bacterium]